MLNIKSILSFIIVLLVAQSLLAQNPVNWRSDQLIEPQELAATIQSKKEIPLIFSIGPGATIPYSKDIGIIKEEENLKNFKKQLSKLPKDSKIVVYCGCCPYEHCPNIRPAIQVLKDMKFTNFYLLDLPHNIRVDWINKGYPKVE